MAGKRNIRSVPVAVGKAIALGMEITSKITRKLPKITREAVKFLTCQARFNITKTTVQATRRSLRESSA